MVKKHWVPLLTEQAREAWDSVENYNVIRSPPLWPQFETLIEEEGEKAQSRGNRRPRKKNLDKHNCCNTCDEEHPKGKHTRSQIEKTKQIIWQAREIDSDMDMETTTCRDCRRFTRSGDHQTCGACGETRNQ